MQQTTVGQLDYIGVNNLGDVYDSHLSVTQPSALFEVSQERLIVNELRERPYSPVVFVAPSFDALQRYIANEPPGSMRLCYVLYQRLRCDLFDPARVTTGSDQLSIVYNRHLVGKGVITERVGNIIFSSVEALDDDLARPPVNEVGVHDAPTEPVAVVASVNVNQSLFPDVREALVRAVYRHKLRCLRWLEQDVVTKFYHVQPYPSELAIEEVRPGSLPRHKRFDAPTPYGYTTEIVRSVVPGKGDQVHFSMFTLRKDGSDAAHTQKAYVDDLNNVVTSRRAFNVRVASNDDLGDGCVLVIPTLRARLGLMCWFEWIVHEGRVDERLGPRNVESDGQYVYVPFVERSQPPGGSGKLGRILRGYTDKVTLNTPLGANTALVPVPVLLYRYAAASLQQQPDKAIRMWRGHRVDFDYEELTKRAAMIKTGYDKEVNDYLESEKSKADVVGILRARLAISEIIGSTGFKTPKAYEMTLSPSMTYSVVRAALVEILSLNGSHLLGDDHLQRMVDERSTIRDLLSVRTGVRRAWARNTIIEAYRRTGKRIGAGLTHNDVCRDRCLRNERPLVVRRAGELADLHDLPARPVHGPRYPLPTNPRYGPHDDAMHVRFAEFDVVHGPPLVYKDVPRAHSKAAKNHLWECLALQAAGVGGTMVYVGSGVAGASRCAHAAAEFGVGRLICVDPLLTPATIPGAELLRELPARLPRGSVLCFDASDSHGPCQELAMRCINMMQAEGGDVRFIVKFLFPEVDGVARYTPFKLAAALEQYAVTAHPTYYGSVREWRLVGGFDLPGGTIPEAGHMAAFEAKLAAARAAGHPDYQFAAQTLPTWCANRFPSGHGTGLASHGSAPFLSVVRVSFLEKQEIMGELPPVAFQVPIWCVSNHVHADKTNHAAKVSEVASVMTSVTPAGYQARLRKVIRVNAPAGGCKSWLAANLCDPATTTVICGMRERAEEWRAKGWQAWTGQYSGVNQPLRDTLIIDEATNMWPMIVYYVTKAVGQVWLLTDFSAQSSQVLFSFRGATEDGITAEQLRSLGDQEALAGQVLRGGVLWNSETSYRLDDARAREASAMTGCNLRGGAYPSSWSGNTTEQEAPGGPGWVWLTLTQDVKNRLVSMAPEGTRLLTATEAQGNEYGKVVLFAKSDNSPLPYANSRKQLVELYTAITRAKKVMWYVADAKAPPLVTIDRPALPELPQRRTQLYIPKYLLYGCPGWPQGYLWDDKNMQLMPGVNAASRTGELRDDAVYGQAIAYLKDLAGVPNIVEYDVVHEVPRAKPGQTFESMCALAGQAVSRLWRLPPRDSGADAFSVSDSSSATEGTPSASGSVIADSDSSDSSDAVQPLVLSELVRLAPLVVRRPAVPGDHPDLADCAKVAVGFDVEPRIDLAFAPLRGWARTPARGDGSCLIHALAGKDLPAVFIDSLRKALGQPGSGMLCLDDVAPLVRYTGCNAMVVSFTPTGAKSELLKIDNRRPWLVVRHEGAHFERITPPVTTVPADQTAGRKATAAATPQADVAPASAQIPAAGVAPPAAKVVVVAGKTAVVRPTTKVTKNTAEGRKVPSRTRRGRRKSGSRVTSDDISDGQQHLIDIGAVDVKPATRLKGGGGLDIRLSVKNRLVFTDDPRVLPEAVRLTSRQRQQVCRYWSSLGRDLDELPPGYAPHATATAVRTQDGVVKSEVNQDFAVAPNGLRGSLAGDVAMLMAGGSTPLVGFEYTERASTETSMPMLQRDLPGELTHGQFHAQHLDAANAVIESFFTPRELEATNGVETVVIGCEPFVRPGMSEFVAAHGVTIKEAAFDPPKDRVVFKFPTADPVRHHLSASQHSVGAAVGRYCNDNFVKRYANSGAKGQRRLDAQAQQWLNNAKLGMASHLSGKRELPDTHAKYIKQAADFIVRQHAKGSLQQPPLLEGLDEAWNGFGFQTKTQDKCPDGRGAPNVQKAHQPIQVMQPAWLSVLAPVSRVIFELLSECVDDSIIMVGPGRSAEAAVHKARVNHPDTFDGKLQDADVEQCDSSHFPHLFEFLKWVLRSVYGYHEQLEFLIDNVLRKLQSEWRSEDADKLVKAIITAFILSSGSPVTFFLNTWLNVFVQVERAGRLGYKIDWLVAAGDDSTSSHSGLKLHDVKTTEAFFVVMKWESYDGASKFCHWVHDRNGSYPHAARSLAKFLNRFRDSEGAALMAAEIQALNDTWGFARNPDFLACAINAWAKVLPGSSNLLLTAIELLLRIINTPVRKLWAMLTPANAVTINVLHIGGGHPNRDARRPKNEKETANQSNMSDFERLMAEFDLSDGEQDSRAEVGPLVAATAGAAMKQGGAKKMAKLASKAVTKAPKKSKAAKKIARPAGSKLAPNSHVDVHKGVTVEFQGDGRIVRGRDNQYHLRGDLLIVGYDPGRYIGQPSDKRAKCMLHAPVQLDTGCHHNFLPRPQGVAMKTAGGFLDGEQFSYRATNDPFWFFWDQDYAVLGGGAFAATATLGGKKVVFDTCCSQNWHGFAELGEFARVPGLEDLNVFAQFDASLGPQFVVASAGVFPELGVSVNLDHPGYQEVRTKWGSDWKLGAETSAGTKYLVAAGPSRSKITIDYPSKSCTPGGVIVTVDADRGFMQHFVSDGEFTVIGRDLGADGWRAVSQLDIDGDATTLVGDGNLQLVVNGQQIIGALPGDRAAAGLLGFPVDGPVTPDPDRARAVADAFNALRGSSAKPSGSRVNAQQLLSTDTASRSTLLNSVAVGGRCKMMASGSGFIDNALAARLDRVVAEADELNASAGRLARRILYPMTQEPGLPLPKGGTRVAAVTSLVTRELSSEVWNGKNYFGVLACPSASTQLLALGSTPVGSTYRHVQLRSYEEGMQPTLDYDARAAQSFTIPSVFELATAATRTIQLPLCSAFSTDGAGFHALTTLRDSSGQPVTAFGSTAPYVPAALASGAQLCLPFCATDVLFYNVRGSAFVAATYAVDVIVEVVTVNGSGATTFTTSTNTLTGALSGSFNVVSNIAAPAGAVGLVAVGLRFANNTAFSRIWLESISIDIKQSVASAAVKPNLPFSTYTTASATFLSTISDAASLTRSYDAVGCAALVTSTAPPLTATGTLVTCVLPLGDPGFMGATDPSALEQQFGAGSGKMVDGAFAATNLVLTESQQGVNDTFKFDRPWIAVLMEASGGTAQPFRVQCGLAADVVTAKQTLSPTNVPYQPEVLGALVAMFEPESIVTQNRSHVRGLRKRLNRMLRRLVREPRPKTRAVIRLKAEDEDSE